MTDADETDFSPSPGDVVFDRDDDDPDRAVVVNTPQILAEDWMVVRFEKTVAEDNPQYPPDALVAVVMYEAYIEEYADTMPDWDRKHALSITALNEKELNYYVFPYPRLAPAESESESESELKPQPESEPPESDESSVDESAQPTLTDIQHVGEARAADFRAVGYESVEAVATTDQSAVAEIDGIGETRAETITASAASLLDEQPDGPEPDASDETDTDTESRETTEADMDPSATIVALSRYLDSNGIDTTIAADGHSVRVSTADGSYRVSLDGVEGDGPHQSQLEEAVEKVRTATENK